MRACSRADTFSSRACSRARSGSGGIALDEFEGFFADPARSGTPLSAKKLAKEASRDANANGSSADADSSPVRTAVHDIISMSDFVAARNDARDKPPQTRLTASDRPLLMGNTDGERKVDLRHMMELAPHSVMHTTPLPRLHRQFRTLGLRHIFVTDMRNEVCERAPTDASLFAAASC